MKYRQVGKTGLRVSKPCLGALTFGRETTEEDSFKILGRFAEEGGNFVDSADGLIIASKIS
jgi:aryl-alcohol dehydrogenase-like predicted oxidoreductase